MDQPFQITVARLPRRAYPLQAAQLSMEPPAPFFGSSFCLQNERRRLRMCIIGSMPSNHPHSFSSQTIVG
ncbi:hypothetical protein I7I53_06058 [Histoplasma capsulatum var. duboisii H88]|uniref:Uncharacterized protein n=1 Tax=Ajellomyces capsulatus (strain H88) TaxID=544711 RepID=A0A8A1L9X3_AJEC8|nr:hypothetical protein I7I53_06058 [Histoplasma capsulatum var. duboisii H88]